MRHGQRTPTRLLLVRRAGHTAPEAAPRTRGHRRTLSYIVPKGAPETVVEDDPAAALPIPFTEATTTTPDGKPEPTLKWELIAMCPLLHYRGLR